MVTDENGAEVDRLSYDAWGKRRDPDGTDDGAGDLPDTYFTETVMTRGYTGHEMLDGEAGYAFGDGPPNARRTASST